MVLELEPCWLYPSPKITPAKPFFLKKCLKCTWPSSKYHGVYQHTDPNLVFQIPAEVRYDWTSKIIPIKKTSSRSMTGSTSGWYSKTTDPPQWRPGHSNFFGVTWRLVDCFFGLWDLYVTKNESVNFKGPLRKKQWWWKFLTVNQGLGPKMYIYHKWKLYTLQMFFWGEPLKKTHSGLWFIQKPTKTPSELNPEFYSSFEAGHITWG